MLSKRRKHLKNPNYSSSYPKFLLCKNDLLYINFWIEVALRGEGQGHWESTWMGMLYWNKKGHHSLSLYFIICLCNEDIYLCSLKKMKEHGTEMAPITCHQALHTSSNEQILWTKNARKASKESFSLLLMDETTHFSFPFCKRKVF